jgi:hypothetical protein
VAQRRGQASTGAPVTAAVAPPATAEAESRQKRSRLSQEDIPSYSLDQALRVPQAIADSYAFRPTRSMNVAHAMNMTPSSGSFRMVTGAAVAYGLTTAGGQAPEIGITPLGLRIVRPTSEGDDIAAKREAFLRPRIIGEFLRRYDGAPIPSDEIAKNVLQEQGVPTDRLVGVFDMIIEGAITVGFLRDISGKRYVDLVGAPGPVPTNDDDAASQPTPLIGTVPQTLPASSPAPVAVSVGQGIHINIEIHIAADASSATIEDIFRNMRRYVLTADGQVDNGPTNSG